MVGAAAGWNDQRMRSEISDAPEQKPRDPDERLNSREAAAILGVDLSWVKNHCTRCEPRLPFVQLGGGRYATRRFRRRHLEQFIDNQTKLPLGMGYK